jgi:ATP/maltotriose-dependent transcriptional regulator MalT
MISAEEMDAYVSKIYSAVGRKEGDFWMQPEETLTAYLVADLNHYCNKQRLVLMIDTYESIGAFDSWVREQIFANLDEYALLVIAGRQEVDRACWQDYALLMKQIELKPFTRDESYAYLKQKGVINKQVIAEMTDYTGGHPLTLALLSGLSNYPRAGDLVRSPERREIIRTLLDRVIQKVTEKLNQALEVCAILRVVNQDSLRFMLELTDAQQIFSELRTFDFINVCNGGIAFHDTIWDAMNEELRWRSPEHYLALHAKAAQYYEQLLAQPNIKEWERLNLERLYHRIRANEIDGIKLFQEVTEELVRYRMVSRLRDLLNDVNGYSLELDNSHLWRKYYNARLAHLKAQLDSAEKVYEVLGEDNKAEPKLQAYTLCDWGELLARHQRLGQTQGIEKATDVLKRSLQFGMLDLHLVNAYISLARVAGFSGDLVRHREFLEKAKHFFEQRQDRYGVVSTFFEIKRVSGHCGVWKEFIKAHELGLEALRQTPTHIPILEIRLSGGWAYTWALIGRYSFSEKIARENLKLAREQEDKVSSLYILRDLGWALGVQRKFDSADACLSESLEIAQRLGRSQRRQQGLSFEFWGAILTKQGRLEQARDYAARGLEIHESLGDTPGLLEPLNWLGAISEIQSNMEGAAHYYQRHGECDQYGRHYLKCEALTGLVRVKHAQNDYTAIPSLLTEAERLAQQYEYNDHLASLRLTQGHITWEGHVSEWGSGFDVALSFYQQALVYALRYNRFLLDEVLWGGGIKTPLRPIILSCQSRGEEGRRMLVNLRDWWQTGINNIGTPRTDTISSIPEGISLLEAEHIGRELELGDGSQQQSVGDHIKHALTSTSLFP